MNLRQRNMHNQTRGQRIGRTSAGIVLAVSLAIGGLFAPVSQSRLVSEDDTRQLASCTNARRAPGGYSLSGWKVAAGTTAHLNVTSAPRELRGAVRRVLQASFDSWRVDRAVPRVFVATDGRLTSAKANRRNDLMFGRLPAGKVAITYTWKWSDGLVESDVIFNNLVRWFVATNEGDGCYESIDKFDLGNIATHEFGHVYGLGHPKSGRFESMYTYSYTGETLKRTPAKGDVAGIKALY